jgi:hypothetical protein
MVAPSSRGKPMRLIDNWKSETAITVASVTALALAVPTVKHWEGYVREVW